MKQTPQHILTRLTSIGVLPQDDDETRLNKALLVLSSIPFMVTGVIWGVMYMQFGEVYAGLIPLMYAIVSFFSLVYFAYTCNFRVYRFSQLLFILVLPFALMVALGGFVKGSAVILWGLISPLGAMLFDKPQNAPPWFGAYALLVLISGVLCPVLNLPSYLTDEQQQMFFIINFISVGALIFLMVYYFVNRKNFFQQRTEELLLNILPKETAHELRSTGTTAARHFEQVTVLFTDFKNFTAFAERVSPQELVNEINYCYSAFDNIITARGLEKIKTIGDSYMCAGGLPLPVATHAEDTVLAAIEIRDFMEREKEKRSLEGRPFFEIRIGCHTGPVVAGVVGVKKFAYDIWGDTVNIASRMESSGEPGKVNISGTTCELVKHRFTCEPRGKIQAKNKGLIDMYFAERR